MLKGAHECSAQIGKVICCKLYIQECSYVRNTERSSSRLQISGAITNFQWHPRKMVGTSSYWWGRIYEATPFSGPLLLNIDARVYLKPPYRTA